MSGSRRPTLAREWVVLPRCASQCSHEANRFGPPIAALQYSIILVLLNPTSSVLRCPVPFFRSVLMMYANSGNLDTFIEARHSPSPGTGAFPPHNADSPSPPLDAAEMKRRFRTRRASSKLTRGEGAITQEQMRKWEEERRAVMLLSKEEVGSLFGDVVRGLAFLVRLRSIKRLRHVGQGGCSSSQHSNSILHLDLKCSNVLLHLRDGLLM